MMEEALSKLYTLSLNPAERIGIAAEAAYKAYFVEFPGGPGPAAGWFESYLAEYVERERIRAKSEEVEYASGSAVRGRKEFLQDAETRLKFRCEQRLATV